MLIEANLTFMDDFADLKDEISQAEKITLELAQKSK
jgi:hypothetical protein